MIYVSRQYTYIVSILQCHVSIVFFSLHTKWQKHQCYTKTETQIIQITSHTMRTVSAREIFRHLLCKAVSRRQQYNYIQLVRRCGAKFI
jgi:protein associated with RNAse G/E